MNEVIERLAVEEGLERQAGLVPDHEVLPGQFLEVGLKLEEQQYVLLSLLYLMSSHSQL